MRLPKILHSKIFLAVASLAVLIMLILEYQQWSARKQVDQEIANLQEQERQLSQGNTQLEQSINFLSQPEYQEKLARLQLNLQKEGEIVVEFPSTKSGDNPPTETKTKSNLLNWWDYIFIN